MKQLNYVVAGLLGAAVVLNVVEFPLVENSRGSRWQAANLSSTSDLIDLAEEFNPNVSGWYSIHWEVGEKSPDATVVLPDGTSVQFSRFNASMLGYGHAAAVHREQYPFEFGSWEAVLSDDGLEVVEGSAADGRVSFGPGRTGFSNWVLVLADATPVPGRTLVAFELDLDGTEYLALIDEKLLNDQVKQRGTQ